MSEKHPTELSFEDSNDSWGANRIHILAEIERLQEGHDALQKEVTTAKLELTSLKTKMAIYIGIASTIVSVAVSIALKLLL